MGAGGTTCSRAVTSGRRPVRAPAFRPPDPTPGSGSPGASGSGWLLLGAGDKEAGIFHRWFLVVSHRGSPPLWLNGTQDSPRGLSGMSFTGNKDQSFCYDSGTDRVRLTEKHKYGINLGIMMCQRLRCTHLMPVSSMASISNQHKPIIGSLLT